MKKLVEDIVANEEKKRKTKKVTKRSSNNNEDILKNSLTRGVNNRELEDILKGLTTTIINLLNQFRAHMVPVVLKDCQGDNRLIFCDIF